MSNKVQIEKNLDLSSKLADFIAENPSIEESVPVNASYVFISATDKQLNKANLKLAESLMKEGKTVVKAEETKDKNHPWKLVPLGV